MESSEQKTIEDENATRCSIATSWTIAGGSLNSSVTIESSDSPIDEAAGSSDPKAPQLVLHPPAQNPSPCEITISFTKKHEVRQVYVRSTARVYEIYCALDPRRDNDYLCTVRCSIASKDEELTHAVDIGEVSTNFNGSNEQLTEGKFRSDTNSSNNEDDWVEVKVLNSPTLDSRNSSLLTKIDTCNRRSVQVFYEATAEMTDSDPCTFLTLRLLSLHDKSCVLVDEIYVFADPVEFIESENEVGQMENSSGSSLMSMLVPTLLQLSKTGISGRQERQTYDARKEQKYGALISDVKNSATISNNIQQEGESFLADKQEATLLKANGFTSEPAQLQIPSETSALEKKPDFIVKEHITPYSHLERSLEQLASQVGRVEELCLRFEESMVRPISSIEARLQHVEQQLEVLAKNSEFSGFPSCSRFSAPEFTSIESDSNSFYNEKGNSSCGAMESNYTIDIPSDKLSIPPDDVSASVSCKIDKQCTPPDDMESNIPSYKLYIPPEDGSAPNGSASMSSKIDKLCTPLDDISALTKTTHSFPSLVVMTPEFSNADGEEENVMLEPVTDSLGDQPRKALSVDDALASALSGLLSSISSEHLKYTPILTVNAPEFSSGDDCDDDKLASPRVESEILAARHPCLGETSGTECIKESVSTSCNISPLKSEGEVTSIHNNDSQEIVKGVDKHGLVYEKRKEVSSRGNVFYPTMMQFELDMERPEVNQAIEATHVGEAGKGTSNFSNSKLDSIHIPIRFLGDLTDDGSDCAQEEAGAILDLTVPTEVTKGGSNLDILQEVLNISLDSSTVDFEIPILDVKFMPPENSCNTSFLEALQSDRQELDAEAPCVKESESDTPTGEQCSLILVEDVEPLDPSTVSHFHVDFDHCDMSTLCPTVEVDNLQASSTFSVQEMFSASLI